MKHLLEKSVQALVAGNQEEARAAFGEYVKAKSRAIFEKVEKDQDLLKGHCDGCGHDATISPTMRKSWECGNCGSKKFVADGGKSKIEEAIEKGAFHRWLGKDEDEPITDADIEKGLKSKDKHARKMAQFVKNTDR